MVFYVAKCIVIVVLYLCYFNYPGTFGAVNEEVPSINIADKSSEDDDLHH